MADPNFEQKWKSGTPLPGAPPAEPGRVLGVRWLGWNPIVPGVAAAVICFLTAGVALWSFHQSALRILKQNLEDDVRVAAKVIAMNVDPALHATFTKREQESSPEYLKAIAVMEKARRTLNHSETYKYVYTFVLQDGDLYFVLDPTPEGDADHDGLDDKSHIGDIYDEDNPRLRSVFKTGEADVDKEPVADAWGTFVSGYAPVLDANGKVVAVAGVDLELSRFNDALAGLRRVGLLGALGAGSLSVLGGLAVWSYHRRLQRSISKLVTAMDDAKAADRAKSEFLATISHEIRTPMNGVLGMISLLRETPLNTRQREFVETIHSSGNLLQRIIDDILDWSKIDIGAVNIREMPVNVHALLGEVASFFEAKAAGKRLTLEMTAAPDCPGWVLSDPTRLRQILLNLTGNAIKFTHQGGVKVFVRPDKAADGAPTLLFSVRDTGIGISPEQQEKLFQPFSQGDSTTTRSYGGTGLGLVISRRLCEAMGGDISYESTLGEGSAFTFFVRAQPVEIPPAGSAPVVESPPPSAEREKKAEAPVLLLSPDRMLVSLAAAVFRRMQLPLEHRADPAEAGAFLKEHPCRAVLVDVGQLDVPFDVPRGEVREARLIALVAEAAAPVPAGFDAVLPRLMRLHDIEAALRA